MAPSPIKLLTKLEGPTLAERLLSGFSTTIASEEAKACLQSLRQALPGITEPEIPFRVEKAIIDASLYLERPSLAEQMALKMLGSEGSKVKPMGCNGALDSGHCFTPGSSSSALTVSENS